MILTHRTPPWRAGLGLALVFLALGADARAQQAAPTPPPDEKAAALQKLIESVQRDPASASPQAMAQLLTLSKEAGRPQAAAAVIKSFLAQRRETPPELILAAAEMAELAGDIRSAATRYKQYLKVAPAGADTSAATLRLYRLLLDGMGAGDDTYRLMAELGAKGRATPALKRYDGWFLDEARRRKDVPGLASRLAAVLADQMPIELERMVCWDHLDWLMRELAAAAPAHYAAVPDCRKIAGLIRENAAWSARFRFLTENLAFRAAAAGKDETTLDREFDPVASAARAYLDAAPTAAAMREVARTFSGGWERYDERLYGTQFGKKAPLFADTFAKMSEAERNAILGDADGWEARHWVGKLTTRERFGQLMAANGDFFRKSPETWRVPLVTDSTNPAVYRALAPAVQGMVNGDALVVTALGSSDDLFACWQRIVQDSWFLGAFGDVRDSMDRVWRAYSQFPRPAEQKLSPQYDERTLCRFGAEVLSKTPVFMFDGELARRYITAAWRFGSPDGLDKSKVGEHFHRLNWIPYTEKDRQYIFGDARNEFRQWADSVRNQQNDRKGKVAAATTELEAARKQRQDEAAKPNANLGPIDARVAELTKTQDGLKAELAKFDAAANSIAAIEETFRLCTDPKLADPNKGPDDLSRNLAKVVSALAARNQAGFAEAARAAYAAVRNYPAQRTPFARAAFLFIVRNRLDVFDTLDLQCEWLADQLASGTPEGGNRLAGEVYGQIHDQRPWGWNGMAGPEREKLLKVNAVLAKTMRELFAKNQFSDTVFRWFRDTRRRQDWSVLEKDLDIMEQVLARKDLYAARNDRGAMLQSLTRNDFPKLLEKYPAETWFDDMVAEDVRKHRYAAPVFSYSQNGGRDDGRKIANALAEVFQTYERLPFGYDGGPVVYQDQARFWDVHGRAMGADAPLRDAMLAKLESFGGKTRFDNYANGGVRLGTISLNGPAGRKQFFDGLAAWTAGRSAEPMRSYQPAIGRLASIKPAELADDELAAVVRLLQLYPAWNWWDLGNVDQAIHEGLVSRKRSSELFPLAGTLWSLARQYAQGDTLRARMVDYTAQLADADLTDLAATYAAAGLDIVGGGLRDDQRNALMAVRAKALSGMLAAVAVDRADRRFPMFQAQADYQIGKHEEAWQTYLANRPLFRETHRELDPAFSVWLIGKTIDVGNYADAEANCRMMIEWVDRAPQSFDPEDRARLLLVYAQMFFARQEYPRARAICEQVAAAAEFGSTRAQRDAELRIAEIDRITGQYDKAAERLDNMLRDRDPYVQTEANHQLALVKFDQEEYPESRTYVDKVLAVAPSHPSARILEGKLYLRMKKLVEATEVRVGLTASQQTIMPGKPLKVTLEDRNLGIVGRSANVDIRAWTASGDEETFSLLPFGDSKTKFEGQIPTALAPTQKGDRTLQVLGGDTVHYDYSEAFKKANHITGQESISIRVICDSELYVSSGRILSREEQEQQELERTIRARLKAEQLVESTEMLSTVRSGNEVKPGNRINVRVVDPDQSTTAGKDKLVVRVTSSSGDRVNRVVLEETGTHTGVFEGSVATASALATAFASDSEEGKEPNFAITGAEYPAWVGLPDNRRPKWFSVDLNNSVALGTLKVVADVPGRKLKRFVVQTSANGQEFRSLCAWPSNIEGWLGAGRLDVVRFAGRNGAPKNLAEYREYLDVGCLANGCEKIVITPPPLDINWDQNVNGLGDRLQLAWEGVDSWYIGHLQLSFYQPVRAKRVFSVSTGAAAARKQGLACILTLDGEAGGKPGEVGKSLGKGFHRLDVYFSATRRAGMRFRLEDERGPCKPDMFAVPAGVDPKELAASRAVAFVPAAITNSADNSQFTVAFPTNTTARMLRLWLLDFETDAPSIRRLHLTGADGKVVLPTAQDVVKGKENEQLEVVPGDRITITYEDPQVLTKERRFSEAFMNATFRNATLSACFVESVLDGQGNRKPLYIPMRRFKPGDTINVFINDPDGDTSDATDTLKFTARVGAAGKPVVLDGLETEPHSGVFLGRIFPVLGAPQRASELQMGAGDDLTLSYLDVENTDPGIPWERLFTVEQTYGVVPELRLYHYTVAPLAAADVRELARAEQGAKKVDEYVPVRSRIVASRPELPQTEGTRVLLGCPLVAEVRYPTVAQSPASRTALYIQTAAGRKLHGSEPPAGGFDTQVPGTVRVDVTPGDCPGLTPPPGYRSVSIEGPATEESALDEGRFTFLLPVKLGAVAPATRVDEKLDKAAAGQGARAATDQDWTEVGNRLVPVVRVRGDDELFVGYAYTDEKGSNRWLTASAKLASDPLFDVMDRRYQQPVTNLHVGETLYYRVTDPGLDRSDDKDSVQLQIAAGAEKRALTLSETFAHSGVFKGLSPVLYSGDPAATNTPDAVKVNYGDLIAAEYRTVSSSQALTCAVQVLKGADGSVQPFTKRFGDSATAVQTQFTVAEAYFEMAKNHRKLGQEELARREIGQGKKLLEESLRDYPTTDARAQAEYLLADLALEFSEQVEDAQQKGKYHMEAVSRFTDIVASYPDSTYAPKAQFKKALTYEKMGRIDEACEEYVKLSYRYPDNELVAETIARLGQYFLVKGKGFQDQMAAEKDLVARERIRMQSAEMFKTAAQVFGRLAVRFPDHKLAGKTTVLSGQCYLRAEDFGRAIDVFNAVVAAKKAEPELIAEAMYWCGDSHVKRNTTWEGGGDLVEAYRMFKKLTWDYPETVWAKYARGRLSEEQMAKLDAQESGN